MRAPSTLDKAINLFLASLCFGSILLLVFESTRDYSLKTERPLQAEMSAVEEIQNTHNFSLPPISDYNEIVDRPLFQEDRRPFVPSVDTIQKPTPKRKVPAKKEQAQNFSLSAIIITDEKRIALLHVGRNKKLHKVSLGDELQGWTIAEIKPGKISMQKGTETKEMELAVKSSPKQTRRNAQNNENKGKAVTIAGEKLPDTADTAKDIETGAPVPVPPTPSE